jgi:hypothetical protein
MAGEFSRDLSVKVFISQCRLAGLASGKAVPRPMECDASLEKDRAVKLQLDSVISKYRFIDLTRWRKSSRNELPLRGRL